jgi:MscS family membrane protein
MAPWWQSYIPRPLFEVGPYGIKAWQWIGLVLVVVLAIVLGRLVARAAIGIATRVARHTRTTWDDLILAHMKGPVALVAAVILYRAFEPVLELPANAAPVSARFVSSAVFVCVYWAALRAISVGKDVILASERAQQERNLALLVPQIARIVRWVLGIMLVISLLAQMGYHVTSLITGLGIGGIAIALAAQSSLQNVIASIGIAADKPFTLGDTVKIDNDFGTVESIGLRSTRIRNLDRSLISWPNGALATRRIECVSARERIHLACIIGVEYGTTSEQLRRILDGCEEVIRSHPHAWQELIIVKFQGFGDSALEIEVMCWFETLDYPIFRDYREEVLLGFMKVVEEAGSSFAFPTRTVHLIDERGSEPAAPGTAKVGQVSGRHREQEGLPLR